MGLKEKIISYRHEHFGGILMIEQPKALVYVDHECMRSLGLGEHPIWESNLMRLSGPTEAKLMLSDSSQSGCFFCLTDINNKKYCSETGYEEMKNIVQNLARSKVFFVLIEGGDCLTLPWLFDLVRDIRSHRMLATLTTSGTYITPEIAKECREFERIWLYLDVQNDQALPMRKRNDVIEATNKAIKMLQVMKCQVGITFVVTRNNFHLMFSLAEFAFKTGVDQVELRRIKPSGRTKESYYSLCLTPEQSDALLPSAYHAMSTFGIKLKLDCSFGPMIFSHAPNIDQMEIFDITGCIGGESSIGIWSNGEVRACNYLDIQGYDFKELQTWWNNPESFPIIREWRLMAQPPCDICNYFTLCRGGCRSVSSFVLGDPEEPDPECPIVHKYRSQIF